jgi:3-oxoacyl-[acyl-carrier-protein] synthase II
MERVVITGLGAISALGIGVNHNFEQAFAGVSGIDRLTFAFPRQLRCCVAAQIRFPLPEMIKKSELSLFDRFSMLAWIAASEAVKQSGISHDSPQLDSSGVFWGTGMGGAQTLENGYVDMFIENKDRVRPLSIVASMNSSAAAQIALKCGFGGTVNTYSSACVSSAQAIGEAYRHIRNGYANRILAGGSEALLTFGIVNAWDSMRALAIPDREHPEQSCRPFSLNRSGLVLGEAGAAVMLESMSSANKRGATILAELVGYGSSNDATHMTNPNPAGQARAMTMAINEAGLSTTDIDYINAHGAGTPAGDVTETESIKKVFGEHAKRLMISSTKSVHGHTLGAAAALEFVLTVKSLLNKAVPPTAFLDESDPMCDLDYVPLQGRQNLQIKAAMSNSFAFGGSNAALIIREL